MPGFFDSRLPDCRSALAASCSRPRMRAYPRRRVLPVSFAASFGVCPVSAPRDLRVIGVRRFLRSRPCPAMAVNYDVWPRA